MSLIELFIIAAGLSMDAFAVAICKGLCMPKMNWKHGIIVGLYFGGFQGGMPLIGYLLGSQFKDSIAAFDHWIAFVLLAAIGLNMIKEAFSKEESCPVCSIDPKSMCLLAVATSIDALAVGVTFAFLQVQIVPAISFIGSITFVLSVLGVKVGNAFGTRYKSKAEMAGGVTLILMGARILSSHLMGA
ncbi:MAG: manganese efflux pump MntP family protein [Lacrimispora sp.]|uniref:manganese efflux pump MntP n=1 Tax=Lacrimispora sp. TaxID=2719234 RepID=UPI0039E4F402